MLLSLNVLFGTQINVAPALSKGASVPGPPALGDRGSLSPSRREGRAGRREARAGRGPQCRPPPEVAPPPEVTPPRPLAARQAGPERGRRRAADAVAAQAAAPSPRAASGRRSAPHPGGARDGEAPRPPHPPRRAGAGGAREAPPPRPLPALTARRAPRSAPPLPRLGPPQLPGEAAPRPAAAAAAAAALAHLVGAARFPALPRPLHPGSRAAPGACRRLSAAGEPLPAAAPEVSVPWVLAGAGSRGRGDGGRRFPSEGPGLGRRAGAPARGRGRGEPPPPPRPLAFLFPISPYPPRLLWAMFYS